MGRLEWGETVANMMNVHKVKSSLMRQEQDSSKMSPPHAIFVGLSLALRSHDQITSPIVASIP